MNGGRSKPLSGGSSPFGGSPEGRIVLALVIVAVVLGAVAFALFAANQSEDKSLNAKQAELDALSGNYSRLAAAYDALDANYTFASGQLATVKANYDNVTQQYLALQNRSNAVDTRLNTFLENSPTIAFSYTIAPKLLPDNSTDKVITVTAYNLGKTDAGNVRIECTVMVANATRVYNQTFPSVMSLDKRVVSWEFSNQTEIIRVWAGLG